MNVTHYLQLPSFDSNYTHPAPPRPPSIDNHFRDTICSASHLHRLRSTRRLCNCFYFNCVVCENHRIDSISWSHEYMLRRVAEMRRHRHNSPYIQRKEKCANLIENTHTMRLQWMRIVDRLCWRRLTVGWPGVSVRANRIVIRDATTEPYAFLGTKMNENSVYYSAESSRGPAPILFDCRLLRLR